MRKEKFPFIYKNVLNLWKKIFSKKIILAILSGVLLFLLLHDVNFSHILASIKNADKPILLLAFSLHAVGLTISAVRWKLLLNSLSIDSKIVFLIKSYLVATFFNHFIPSTVGGDSVRAYDSYKLGNDKTKGLTVVIVDRFLGLLTLLIFVLISTFFSIEVVSKIPNLTIWLIGISFAAGINVWLIFSPPIKLFTRISNSNNKFISKIGSILLKIGNAFNDFSSKKKVMFKAFFLSVFLQLNVILYYYLISVSLGFNIHFINFSFIIPLTIFVLLIPISINGIGLRENILFFFFSFYGISKAQAIAFAWLEFGMLLILGLIGGLVFMLRNYDKKMKTALELQS